MTGFIPKVYELWNMCFIFISNLIALLAYKYSSYYSILCVVITFCGCVDL